MQARFIFWPTAARAALELLNIEHSFKSVLKKENWLATFKLILKSMKTLGSFINNKNIQARRMVIDQQSVFYVFQLVIKSEYGRLGAENIMPVFFKDKKIFIKATGSTWASEIWLNRGHIVRKVNEQLGGEEIIDLAMNQ